MRRIAHLIDRFNEAVGWILGWFALAMVIIQFGIVIAQMLDTNSIAVQESITYLHTFLFMLGAAFTLRMDGHVRVDIFYNQLSPRGKGIVDLFGTLFFLIPVAAFIGYASWEYVAKAWALKEGSVEAGGLNYVYLLKSAIIGMVALLLIQAVSELLKSLANIVSPRTGENA